MLLVLVLLFVLHLCFDQDIFVHTHKILSLLPCLRIAIAFFEYSDNNDNNNNNVYYMIQETLERYKN